HDLLGRLACPALELDELRGARVVERPEPIAVPEQHRILERGGGGRLQRLEDRFRVQDPLPGVVVEIRRAASLAELHPWRWDLVLALHPPVDGIRSDTR